MGTLTTMVNGPGVEKPFGDRATTNQLVNYL